MATVKYLDENGLSTVWSKVKGIVTPKADKVSGATNGHLAGLNSSGNLTDSGLVATNVAQKNGSYSGMTVGAAEDLVSAESVASEFTSRITGGSTAVGKGGTALVDKIKGRTLVWNQLVKNPNFANSSLTGWAYNAGQALSFDNRVLTVTGINGSLYLSQEQRITIGHKYYVSMKIGFYNTTVSSSLYNLFVFYGSSGVQTVFQAPVANSLDKYSVVITADKGGYQFGFSSYPIPPGATLKIDCDYGINIIDLTLMFGAGNEPSTAAEFEALYPLPYYDYHPGKLINNGLQSEYDLTWNQLANPAFVSGKTESGITITKNSDNSYTVSGTASAYVTTDQFCGMLTTGHKFLVKGCPPGGSDSTYRLRFSEGGISETGNGRIFTTTGLEGRLLISILSGYAISGSLVFKPQLFDLTLMFGAGNEPATVEEFEAMFPADYYAYDAGTEQHFSFPQFKTKIETVGFNIWDEEWELGALLYADGSKSTSSNAIRSKNYIPVIPGQTYYRKSPYTDSGNALNRVAFYDINKDYVGTSTGWESFSGSGSFTVPAGAYYMLFYVSTTTYSNEICINLSDTSRNGTYEPYWRSELELGLGDIKVKSHNLWDEEYENGDGVWNYFMSKNYCDCKPNTTYYLRCGTYTNMYYLAMYFYDENKVQISYTYACATTVTSPANARYFKVKTNTQTYVYGNTYHNDICVNESDPAFNGRYEPYGDGGVISITGGLKSAGTVYDEISGGKLVKRIESVDMGTLTWEYNTSSAVAPYFQSSINGAKAFTGAVLANFLCPKYITINRTNAAGTDKTVFSDSGSLAAYVQVKDSAYTDPAIFKTAMSGVPIYYELAQPIEYELADAIPTAMRNDPYGMERRLPEDTAAIVTAPFRADITYSTNIKEAVQSLPQNYINVNSMQDFLAALGEQMGGTWTMRPADGKFDFSFTPNPVEPTL